MENRRPFLSNFMHAIDKNLLLHKPENWTARTHLVWYYGILFIGILSTLCLVIPNDPRADSTVGYWVLFTIIISIVALIFWLIFLLRFNVFKRFGKISSIGRLKTFGLYFASVGLIVFFSYVPALIETIRANLAYGDKEIVDDINNVNIKIVQAEFDSLNHVWSRDSFYVVNELHYSRYEEVVELQNATSTIDSINNKNPSPSYGSYRIIDSADLTVKLKSADSTQKINDSIYILITCPNYTFLDFQYNLKNTKYKLLDNKSIYKDIVRNFKQPNIEQTRKEALAILNKYRYQKNSDLVYVNGQEQPYSVDAEGGFFLNNQRTDIYANYQLQNADKSLSNIIERKFRFSENHLPWLIRLWFYISFFITILVFIFRHSTTVTYFLSLLTIVILSILSGLLIAFSDGGESSVFSWFIFYAFLFCAVSIASLKARKRSIVSAIAINLFTLTIPFIPLSCVALYYSQLRKECNEISPSNHPKCPIDYSLIELYYQYAEILGLLLFLILLPTILHKLYRKWYALPQE
ncbi:MAG: hypothetical protein MUE72_09390 [Chitinophagaceae bacterium]|nr:hypothetical protein [Chitinophagaceae bacterium]